jgi:6-phosphogluconate dehydrogenase
MSQPLTLIGEAVFARCLSALKEDRVRAAGILAGPEKAIPCDRAAFLGDLMQALYASKITSYAQGFQLMRAAAESYEWRLNYGGVAQMWRGGCIIRSAFLDKIKDAYDADPDLTHLLMDPFFQAALGTAMPHWRRVVSASVQHGIPLPAIGSALAYFDGYRCDRLPANLLQAQRDYFGAHSYERLDKPRGQFFHTNWTGRGGATPASTYSV